MCPVLTLQPILPGDYEFTQALLEGMERAGCFGWTPDTMGEGAYSEPLRCLKEHGGLGIPGNQIMGTGSDQGKDTYGRRCWGHGYWS